MQRHEKAHAAIYAALFVVLGSSALLFLSRYGGSVRAWENFTYCYLVLLVLYTWYQFGLLLNHDVRPAKHFIELGALDA